MFYFSRRGTSIVSSMPSFSVSAKSLIEHSRLLPASRHIGTNPIKGS
jgi:hypothetical protein